MEMYAYIDESGDEGIGGKGTKWFIITALIASQEEAASLGNTYHRIKSELIWVLIKLSTGQNSVI